MSNYPRRWNGAPSQEFQVTRQNHKAGDRSIDLLKCGLIPYWCSDLKGGRKSINARAETVASLPTFHDAYARRRCILPVDGFFEWRAAHGGKQPYAIAMEDGSPFGIAGIWEDYCDRIIELRQGVIVFDRLPSELSESLAREIYCSEENGDEEVELHSTRNRPVPGSQPDRADASPASVGPRA